MSKAIKYYGAIILSVLCICAPAAGLMWIINEKDTLSFVFGGILIAFGLLMYKPAQALRIKYREFVEYDEFGRSKTKGVYEKLSKEERDKIDLQKTADMERIMNSSAIKKITKTGSECPEIEMEKLVGLGPVKQKMREMVARMQFESMEKKKKNKMDNSISGRHMIFYGSPGTGKTTVARILTGFLYKYGYIKENKCVEVDGNFLKAGSDTATKTELIIRQAYDGVLFIDEAYALMEGRDGSGQEAIATLIKQMEDNRGRFILILAGYTNEMKALLDANPGFESRIKEYLDFPDYNNAEMRAIFSIMAMTQGFTVSPSAFELLDKRVDKERKLRSFGNGRTARNILDETLDKHALNFVSGKYPEEYRKVICAEDISTELKRDNFD